MRFKLAKAGIALNKMHAFYIGECYKVKPNAECFGGNGGIFTQAELTTAAASMLAQLTASGTTAGGMLTGPDSFVDQIRLALQVPSGYFSLPEGSTGNATVANKTIVDIMLWDFLTNYYGYPTTNTGTLPTGAAVTVNVRRVWGIIVNGIGKVAGYSAPGASSSDPNLPQPNLSNGICNVSNCCPGVIGTGGNAPSWADLGSHPVRNPYQYLAQVATNLSTTENVLDWFVRQAVTDMGLDAFVNLCQWNALGGWACEIKVSDPSNTGKPSGQDIVPANGCTLTDQWWTGTGVILGISDYTESCPNFEIAAEFIGD